MHKFLRFAVILLFIIVALAAAFGYYAKTRQAAPTVLPDVFSRIETVEACSQQIGFASSCWENGLRLVRMTDVTLKSGFVNITLRTTIPQSAATAIISPTVYWWSHSRRSWQPIILHGISYQNSVWLEKSASATLSLPQTELAAGLNYLITWDYIYNPQENWLGPRCVPGTDTSALNSCWRLVEFILE